MSVEGRCRVCGLAVPPAGRFCGTCGAPVEVGLAPDVPIADPLVGRRIADRYRIVRLLGRGAMGVVYEVEHLHIGKRLAMKLLRGELAGDPTMLRRLRREAEAASRLSSPSIVQVFDFGQAEGLSYLVMELVDGRDLARVLAEDGALPFPRLARLVLSILPGLAEAHAAGIVHRDLKPENLVVFHDGERERAKVLDFGLAALVREHFDGTVTGHVVGTPHTMAPEQVRGEAVDARADLYALGCVMVRALTGKPVFPHTTAIAVLQAHLAEAPEPPSRRVPGLPPEVDALILDLLEKRREDRPADVHEVGERLRAALAAEGHTSNEREPTSAVRERDAMRREIEAFERSVRRRTTVPLVVAAVLVSTGALLAVAFYGMRDGGSEREPNDDPETATPLEGGVVRGHLGRRRSRELSDLDAYTFDEPCAALDIAVAAPPNVDVVVEVRSFGTRAPALVIDGAGVGGDEVAFAFPFAPRPVLLVVRERALAGVLPVENVSDPYTLRVRCAAVEVGEGASEDGWQLLPSTPVRARFGWPTDVDRVCLPSAGRLTASPDPELDLRFEPTDGSAVVDAGGPGALEVFFASGPTCVRLVRGAGPVGASYGMVFASEARPLVPPRGGR